MQGEESESLDAKGNCSESAKLYPEQNPGQDRILDQLTFQPCINLTTSQGAELNRSKPLNILLWEGFTGWQHMSPGAEVS